MQAAQDAHRAAQSKAKQEFNKGVNAALKANKNSNARAYMAHSMEMQAQAAMDAEITQNINNDRAWQKGVQAAHDATEEAKELAETRQAAQLASAMKAHHNNQLKRNPAYARQHGWEMGTLIAEATHHRNIVDRNNAWKRGVYMAHQAQERAQAEIEHAWARGVQAAEVANIQAHLATGVLPVSRHRQAAGAIGDDGFNSGAMYGACAGIAGVLGAYFLLKMYKRNKLSDDFERA